MPVLSVEQSIGDLLHFLCHLFEAVIILSPHATKCCSHKETATLCLFSIARFGQVGKDSLVIEGKSGRGNLIDGKLRVACLRSSRAKDSRPELLRDLVERGDRQAAGPGRDRGCCRKHLSMSDG